MSVLDLKHTNFQPRSALEESVGHLLMGWQLEAASQEHSVGHGCLMEAPGMEHQPGTAWQCLDWPLEQPVTTPSRYVSNHDQNMKIKYNLIALSLTIKVCVCS